MVHTLPRKAREVSDFLLGYVQVAVGTWIELWVEERGQALRYPCFRESHPVAVDQGDHLRKALVQLVKDVPIERNAVGEKPVKCCFRHDRDTRVTQCHDVVSTQLAFQQ